MNQPQQTAELIFDASFVPGRGQRLESLHVVLREIADTNIPVLILGESGTGKDVYARLLHRLSCRSELKKLSCSVLNPEELLQLARTYMESEGVRVGTLFLDGIDELELSCQRVLISMLPENQAESGNGGSGSFPRLISSSSRNLDELVEMGAFRKELYFRINGTCLQLPALRERKEDIHALFQHFLNKHALDLRRTVPAIDQEVLDQLMAHDWPGNIRQLENVARQMVAFGKVQVAFGELRPAPSAPPDLKCGSPLRLAAKAASKKAEREIVLRALERTHWNRKQAARDLQISYKSLLHKIKQIGGSNGKHLD